MANIDKVNNPQAASFDRSQQARESSQAANVRDQREVGRRTTERARGDEVTVSDRGRELQRVNEFIRNVPDVRQNLVDSLRQQVRQGSYQVPDEALAQKLLLGS